MSARTPTSEQGGGCCPATESEGETDAKKEGEVGVDMKSSMVGSAKNIFWKKKPYVLGEFLQSRALLHLGASPPASPSIPKPAGGFTKLTRFCGSFKNQQGWQDFPGCPMVRTVLLLKGVQVQSLVRELRSHMPYGMAK